MTVTTTQQQLAGGLAQLQRRAARQNVPGAVEVSTADRALIDDLFEKLSMLFPIGAPVSSAAGPYKIEWLKTMAVQCVVSQEQVQYGLMRARREQGDRQFWPSPLQFCRWCNPQPEDLNIPTVQNAYREAIQNYRRGSRYCWSHPIVLVTIQAVGIWQFKNLSDKELFSQFSYNYEILMKRVMAGQPLDIVVPKALPDVGNSCRLADPNCEGRQKILDLREKMRNRT
jgi:hypothetical protein